ncbi:hypothetical protein [Methanosarcina mazei]|nr:hypothetical protein [Methanosarcina mazei]
MTEKEKPTTIDKKTENTVPYTVTGNLSAAPKLGTQCLTSSDNTRIKKG